MPQIYMEHVRPLGAGGLGIVDIVRVNHRDLMARKRLQPRWARNPDVYQRFVREVEILSTMEHPNIVRCLGYELNGQEPYYLMPLYARSLRQAMTHQIDWRWVARFGITVAEALAHAHAGNFIHRDLKPENILLDAQNVPVIADWGIGQLIHQQSIVVDLHTQAGLGTMYYCSPEQWGTGRCAPSGDVYALGLILAEMVMGSRTAQPFRGITHDVVGGQQPSIRWFNATVQKMTNPNAQQRHQSMLEVRNDLRRSI